MPRDPITAPPRDECPARTERTTRDKAEAKATRCAICGCAGHATELYPASFDFQSLTPAVFSARRLPDRVHYRMVKCDGCGLVRSDPIADPAVLETLYQQSAFTYGAEVANLKRTYGRYLAKLDSFGVRKDTLLEIGCGNGFFLEQALAHGYRAVSGVEPSREASANASAPVRRQIVCDVMRPGLFAPDQFDVICLFQVFDHIADPGALLEECRRVLKPGGVVLLFNHNVAALSARLLREHSPIVDIEHTYLYSPKTIARLLEQHGFKLRTAAAVWNRVSLYYLARLLPFPKAIKTWILAGLQRVRLEHLAVWIPLGNLWAVAAKTASDEQPRR